MFSVGDGLWFIIKIFVYSSLFILIFSHFGNPTPEQVVTRVRPPAYLALVEYRARARALRPGEEKRRIRQTIQPFPFENLPTELRFTVLSYAVGTDNRMLVSLSSVSKNIRHDVFRECLPRLAIRLATRRQLLSFDRLCFDNPELAKFVQNLWISPSEEEDHFPSHRVIAQCVNVKSLACDTWLLAYGLCSGGEIKHINCRNLTLLRSQNIRGRTLPVPLGAPIFGQLTHLRVVGDIAIPKGRYSNLTHFSYVCARGGEAQCAKIIGKVMRRKEERYPQLSMVVVTQERQGAARSAEMVRQEEDFRMLVYYTPEQEKDIWRDGVLGESEWDKARQLLNT